MAFITTTSAPRTGLLEFATAAQKTIAAKFAAYRTYRVTLNELSSMSNRDLADIGLHRSGIVAIARETAYGK